MLTYSSIAQVGYMMIGVGLVLVTGLTAPLVHLFNHVVIVMKGALFLGAGCTVLFFYAEPVFTLLEPIVGS